MVSTKHSQRSAKQTIALTAEELTQVAALIRGRRGALSRIARELKNENGEPLDRSTVSNLLSDRTGARTKPWAQKYYRALQREARKIAARNAKSNLGKDIAQ